MLLRQGEKVHVMPRTFFQKSENRTLVGTVEQCDAGVVRVCGYIYAMDNVKMVPVRQPEKATRFITLVTGDFIVTPLPDKVDLDKVEYKQANEGLRISDGTDWHQVLNVLTLH